MVRRHYLQWDEQVRAFFQLAQNLELALEWVEKYGGRVDVWTRLMEWLIHIYLQQFRLDVFSSVQGEIRAEHRTQALKGTVGFCMEYFEEIMADGVHLVSGNRSDFKQMHDLGRYLFGFDDGRVRKHWEDRPYRKLYRRAVVGLNRLPEGRVKRRQFQKRLFETLYGQHWLLPYPTSEVLLQTTKQGWRMWYSIWRGAAGPREVPIGGWTWGRKQWEVGRPEAMPEWIEWSKAEWTRWLEHSVGVLVRV